MRGQLSSNTGNLRFNTVTFYCKIYVGFSQKHLSFSASTKNNHTSSNLEIWAAIIVQRMMSEIERRSSNNSFLLKKLVLWIAHTHCTPHPDLQFMQKKVTNCRVNFRTPISLIMTVCILTQFQPCPIRGKHISQIKQSNDYQFLKTPTLLAPCYQICWREFFMGLILCEHILEALLPCKLRILTYKFIWNRKFFCFSPGLDLFYRIFLLFSIRFFMWHCWCKMFFTQLLVTFLSHSAEHATDTEWHKRTGTLEMRSGSERMHTWRRTPSTGRNFQTLIIWITFS